MDPNIMSEENNLSSSNLCITEDVFEQFQANAVLGEEEEYITLSDIVSPQPEIHDLSNDLIEIPYDNEIVLTSNNDNESSQDGGTSNLHNPTDGNAAKITNENNDEDTSQLKNRRKNNIGILETTNQKRGRRKKKPKSDQNLSYTVESENDTFIENQHHDNVDSTTCDKNGASSNSMQEDQKNLRRSRRERRANIGKYSLSPSRNDSINSNRTPGKQIGRPKKTQSKTTTELDATPMLEPDSTNVETSKEEPKGTESEEANPSQKTISRRGRRRKDNTPQADSKPATSSDVPVQNNSDSMDTPLSEPEKPRRGRKKKSLHTDKTIEKKLNHEAVDSVQMLNTSSEVKSDQGSDMDNDDDICLSKIKENINNLSDDFTDSIEENMLRIHGETGTQEISAHPNGETELPAMADFEETIDKIAIKNSKLDKNNTQTDADNSLLVEDPSKRPKRSKAKKNFKYETDSDEDPFANMESSDDDQPKSRKKARYNEDHEYVPGKKQGSITPTSDSNDDLEEESTKPKRKKVFSQSPKKRGRKSKAQQQSEQIPVDIDGLDDVVVEGAQSIVAVDVDDADPEPLSMKPPAEAWKTSNAFENFIAQKIQGSNIKIKKVSSDQQRETVPLDIPVLKPSEPKKFVEGGCQTSKLETRSVVTQTSTPYDVPMKINKPFTPTQSKKACEFLTSVVQTTAELGELMKDKSETFMKKKMSADQLTDTFKMDYCVRKSFLLFKLAKHNLMQMEEDLAKQYDEFLTKNNLSNCRAPIQTINANPKPEKDNDSDCEIVDETDTPSTSAQKTVQKPASKVNPKTVFLNKELSIKVTKKNSENSESLQRHTIWFSNAVQVKKVKPTQSFLAQDSRNKKPPDYVTEKMVSDFFENYYRQRALAVCAPFVTTEWTNVNREYACHYFVKCDDFQEACLESEATTDSVALISINSTDENHDHVIEKQPCLLMLQSPLSLSALCTEAVQRYLRMDNTKIPLNTLQAHFNDEKCLNEPLTLFRLSYQSLFYAQLHGIQNDNSQSTSDSDMMTEPNFQYMPLAIPSLKSLCYKNITQLLYNHKVPIFNLFDLEEQTQDSDIFSESISGCDEDVYLHSDDSLLNDDIEIPNRNKDVKPLFTLCVNLVKNIFNNNYYVTKEICQNQHYKIRAPKSLKTIMHGYINHIMFGLKNYAIDKSTIVDLQDNSEDFTINCINTMSEEAFHRIDEEIDFEREDEYDFEPDNDAFTDDNVNDHHEGHENEWLSQVEMKVLTSCALSVDVPAKNIKTVAQSKIAIRNENTDVNDSPIIDASSTLANANIASHIKLEPVDEVSENVVDSSIIKMEPVHGLDGMTMIPENIIAKSELVETNPFVENDEVTNTDITFDTAAFDHYVRQNKMMRSAADEEDDSDEDLFRRRGVERSEHVPDTDAGNDVDLGLLIPQTFEPLNIDNAKGLLMENSADESNDPVKKMAKKKPEKKKVRPKKTKEVPKAKEIIVPPKEVPPLKEKVTNNEVAMITRRMREKIRQEEKKIESSDSENDDIPLTCNDKNKQLETKKPTKNSKQAVASTSKESNSEIQCNNVDSTDQTPESSNKNLTTDDQFNGFSAIDQNEISSYQKYMKFVYDKIVEKNVNKESNEDDNPSSTLIGSEEPVELLECEPTLPIFSEEDKAKHKKKKSESGKKKSKIGPDSSIPPQDKIPNKEFKEQDGWHLYNIDPTETKLYQRCHILLEKLPESFVDTYLAYQDVIDRDHIDMEVERLANLQTLKRSSLKEVKNKGSQKSKNVVTSDQNVCRSGSVSPNLSDHLDELTPSEDEEANVDDEEPPPMRVPQTEMNLAKNSLMENDTDSDGATEIKKENLEIQLPKPKTKPGPKSKTAPVSSESLMLTADKMMNKELNLLHAPIMMLKEELKEVAEKEAGVKNETKPRKRSLRLMKERVKAEDDSSSEEEKQWVSTKEKLLKKIGKKEDTLLDDAKRAKLVDDFIVRRGVGLERRAAVRGSRRSKKKKLERMKQQRVLSKELFGESSDVTLGGKRGANVTIFKGRRNIRAVIDKKSLQKSTVLANMEEFERKRRLNARQTQLRELLGYEEGVSVLVINDEVCLEYDFDEQRPVVTVHKFFTTVMKAHQYEGVKFMWDACFESLAHIEAGHEGGGCILAHCMGLGKTLQVLALLHTVLTHPRTNMSRVLVCCPLSTVLNWVDEIHKWIGPVTDKIKVFEMSKLKKTYERAYQLEDWYNGGGIFIIGYELFRSLTTLDPEDDNVRPTIINKIRTALLDPGPDIIICDEGHLLKNDCSVLAVAMSRVKTKRRIVLTGTPMQNNLREYYCMVNFVKPNLLGTYSEYSNRFENPIMNGQHRDSQEEDIKLMKARTHILHKVLEGCLQRQEASVLYPYLPKKHEYTVFIPLTKCQWDLYKHYLHNYAMKSKQSVLRDFHVLQKIWSHPLVLHNFSVKKREVKSEKLEDDLALEDKEDIKPPEMETWWLQYLADGEMLNSIDTSNKFVAVFRILNECIVLGDKVLIFSTSLDCLDALEYFLRQINGWNLGQEYYRLDGSVPAEVRQKWVREFNAENNHKTKLFLISTRAGCLGLNMTAANRVIILDTSWNPAHDIQSIFRVYRFGQKKDCYIYRLVAMGSMEQKIYERSVTKQAVACRVVDEQQIDRHYNMAELNELYKFDETGASVAGGVAVGVADVALLRVARDAAVHAVHEHDSLLRGSVEQDLPEYERAAAWMQFQQEHAHKQMQNDIEVKTAEALKKKQLDEELERKRKEEEQRQLEIQRATAASVETDKTESAPAEDLLVPRAVQPTLQSAARGRGRRKVVQCDIPIQPTKPQETAAPDSPVSDDTIVDQISAILHKYNFTQSKGPHQIQKLIATVNGMVQRGETEFGNCEPLTVEIAHVLMRQQPGLKPARSRGRPRKERPATAPASTLTLAPAPAPVPAPASASTSAPAPEVTASGPRLRRRAALQAERQFELNENDDGSQDSVAANVVIDLDDDWHGASDTDSANENGGETETAPTLLAERAKTSVDTRQIQSTSTTFAPAQPDSIVVSDEENAPAAGADKSEHVNANTGQKPPLHPSLLRNNNFIKIVAHTYLAGNPLLDEDAATLAAQYSTLKLLKEYENDGKPITSGPIYDIAVKVLGTAVLERLSSANVEKEPEEGVSLFQLLKDKDTPAFPSSQASTPAPVKKRIGPKSRIKALNASCQDEPKTLPPNQKLGVVPVDRLRGVAAAPAVAPEPAAECILPDDDDVRCLSAPAPSTSAPAPAPAPSAPRTILDKHNAFRTKHISQTLRVTSDDIQSTVKPRTTAATPQQTYATISLDSDEDEAGPVPVSLLAPCSRPVAAPATCAAPVPVVLSGPAVGPMPISLVGPGFRSYPLTIAPDGHMTTYEQSAGPAPSAQPVSLAGAPRGIAPVLGASSGNKPSILCNRLEAATSNVRTVRVTLPPGVSLANGLVFPTTAPASTVQTMTVRAPVAVQAPVQGTAVQTPATRPRIVRPQTLRAVSVQQARMQTPPPVGRPPAPRAPLAQAAVKTSATNLNKSLTTKTICKPGDIFRLTATGQLEVISRVDDEVHAVGDVLATDSGTEARESNIPSESAPPTTHNVNVSSPPPKVGEKEVSERTQRKRRKSYSSSSSDSSRSGTPDPLAILKDVVHIQAPDCRAPKKYPAKPAASKPETKPAPKLAAKDESKWTLATKPNAKLDTKSTSKPNAKPDTKSTSKPNAKPEAKSTPKVATQQKTILSNKTVINKKAATASVTDSIDLTDNEKSTAAVKKPTTTDVMRSITGSSKNIILDGKSKTVMKKDSSNAPSGSPMNIRVTEIKVMAKAEKRSAPSAPESKNTKRIKPTLMTLKDFDIDDIDGIIELD